MNKRWEFDLQADGTGVMKPPKVVELASSVHYFHERLSWCVLVTCQYPDGSSARREGWFAKDSDRTKLVGIADDWAYGFKSLWKEV